MSRFSIRRLRFVGSRSDGQGASELYFRPDQPLHYQAGQHGLVVLPQWKVKPFTIASTPEDDLVMLGTSLDSGSRFKKALAALSVGDSVRLIGPLGGFTLQDTAPSVVMLAQGIGITPFRSILRHAATSATTTRTMLVHVGVQHPFRADTEANATTACYPASRAHFESELDNAAAAWPDATFMVSGSPAFVRTAVARLTALGIKADDIKRDTFYGYAGQRHSTDIRTTV